MLTLQILIFYRFWAFRKIQVNRFTLECTRSLPGPAVFLYSTGWLVLPVFWVVSTSSTGVVWMVAETLQWRYNEPDGVSNHQPRDCLLKRLFRSKKTPKLRVTGLCEGNSPVNGEFHAQRASNAENVSIWWRHYGCQLLTVLLGSFKSWNTHHIVKIYIYIVYMYMTRICYHFTTCRQIVSVKLDVQFSRFSCWVSWRIKSPERQLFVYYGPFVKENHR